MKTRTLLIIISFVMIFCSCKKDDNDSTSPPDVSYALTDLVGTWTGVAENSSNTIVLNLNVNSEGKVSGSGSSSQWSIDSKGKVTGGGSFGFTSGGNYIVASASWSLQLDSQKTSLSGNYDVAFSSLHNMTVILSKE
ncbi:MAG: hypothetical protein HQ565_03195 [Bacteroidetes bacterium]|nr:hypothetical protein [Bacteroidota bacterium]